MRLIDRHIGRAVIVTSLLVLAVLLALFTLMSFLSEIKMVGRGAYGYLQAFIYIILAIPRLSYQLMPVAALLGGLIGLGMLAGQSELTVMQAAGISRGRIIWSVMRSALILVAIAFILGQWVAPRSEVFAQNLRAQALGEQTTLQTRNGLWYRDAGSFVHIRSLQSANSLLGVEIYTLNGRHQLQEYVHAASAVYEAHEWTLHEIDRVLLGPQRLSRVHLDTMIWPTSIVPDLLDVVAIRPERMAIWELYDYLGFLHANDLDASRHELAFWRQALLPVTTLIMVLLSTPFVFGPLRSVSIGQRIMVGALLGIGFYLVDRIFGYVGLVYLLNPLLSAMVPSLLFLCIAWVMLHRQA